MDASRQAFAELAETINSDPGVAKRMGMDEIVYGWVVLCLVDVSMTRLTLCRRFIKVANETMCRPIRALTESRGFATSRHMYGTHHILFISRVTLSNAFLQ